MKKIYILAVGLLLYSCNPRMINLLEREFNYIASVYYLGKLNNVIKINDNSLLIKDSSLVFIKFVNSTNNIIEFNTINNSTQSFIISLFQISNTYSRNEGINISVENNAYKIYDKHHIYKDGKLDNNKNYLYIRNEGNHLKLIINCDSINLENIKIPATEYLILENLQGSSIKLEGLTIEKLKKI